MIRCGVCGREAPSSFKAIENRPLTRCHECFARGGAETAALFPAVAIFFPERSTPDSDKNPTPWEAVAQEVAGPEPVVIAEGQYSPSPAESVRIIVFRGGKSLADRWVRTGDVPKLVSALERGCTVRRGECDAMFATGWTCVWTVDGPPLMVWDSEGVVVEQEDDLLRFRSGDSCRAVDVGHVHGYLEDGWVTRGVRCVLKGGPSIKVAEDHEAFARIDPTYDGLNVMCDAAWVVSLARALGKALGVQVRVDEPL